MKKGILISSIFPMLAACSEFQVLTPETALQKASVGQAVSNPEIPKCEVDYDEFELDTHVLSFEVTGKNGIGIGFNLQGVLQFFGLNLQTEKGQMVAAMSLSETVRPGQSVSYVEGKGESKKQEFSFNLDVAQLGLNYSYFKQTPLSSLTRKTVADGLSKLHKDLEAYQVMWKSKVVFVQGQEFIIPVGAMSGVRPGDLFKIYNVNYIWEDQTKPCESALLMERKTTVEPLVEAEAVQVESNASLLRARYFGSDEVVREGARVEIAQLAGKPKEVAKRRLSRPVRVQPVLSQPISLPNSGRVDLSAIVSEQIRAVMDSYHFRPRN